MLKGIFKEAGLLGKISLFFLMFFTLSAIGMEVVSLIFGNTPDIKTIKISQLVISVLSFIVPPAICGYLWYEKPWETYSLHKFPSTTTILLSVLLIFSISPFINLLAYINEQMALPWFMSGMEKLFREMEDRTGELTQQMLNISTPSDLMLNLLVMAVVPALGEELFCRGALQNIFSEKRNKYAAVWIVAVIFSLLHFQMYGFLPRMVLGALLGYLLVWSGSIWLPILTHFANNAAIVIASYFGKGNEWFSTMENIGKAETFWYGIASAVVSAVIVWIIIKSTRQRPKTG